MSILEECRIAILNSFAIDVTKTTEYGKPNQTS